MYLLRVLTAVHAAEYPIANIPRVEFPAAEPREDTTVDEATPDAVEVHEE
tara:strand:+ start:206 stop:355 length:150 start_codon:yes stop_codon:yes gene_type:complete